MSSFVLDRNRHRVVAFDLFHRIEQVYGNVYVSVETEKGEHHSKVRSAAKAYIREHLGTGWYIGQSVGFEHYRRADGYSAIARRYSVVQIGA